MTHARLTTSVVVVTKDRPEMIRGLLRSLARLSSRPDEILIVDNGSSRSYADVFEEFRSVLPLKVVVETPGGSCAGQTVL